MLILFHVIASMDYERGTLYTAEGCNHDTIDVGYMGEVESVYENINVTPIGESDLGGERLEKRTNAGSGDAIPLHLDGVHLYNLREEPVLLKEFKSVEEAEIFFKDYAKSIGFGVRKNQCRWNK